MKKLLILPFLFFTIFLKAQCPSTCIDSLAYNVSKDTLVISPGFTNPTWKIIAGPGVLGTNVVTGLLPGQTTVLALNAYNGTVMNISMKVITVAPTPIVPRTITSVAIVSGQLVFTFSDGGTQKL